MLRPEARACREMGQREKMEGRNENLETADETSITTKKRKSDQNATSSDETLDTDVVKKKMKKAYTAVEFKFMLKDLNTTFAAFENFIEEAESFTSESDNDIVLAYCKSSPECAEIFYVLDLGKRKAGEYHLIFRTLECILMRMVDDLEKFKSVGEVILRRVLASHMGAIYHQLAMRNKSSHIKSCLRMLTGMVMLGPASARELFLQLEFSNSLSDFYTLFCRRDTKDTQDVRTCVLLFVISFLVVGDDNVIKLIMDQKFLLKAVFKDMTMDKCGTIQSVLPILMEKVVKNPFITKTAKVRVFNEQTLKHLCQIFHWRGPVKWSAAKGKPQYGYKARKEDASSELDTLSASSEECEAVIDVVNMFLTELCCNVKTGITFLDKSYGTSGKNVNHLMTIVLSCLTNVLDNEVIQELAVRILQTCPDQISRYLTTIKTSFTPKPSTKWLTAVKFLCRINESLPALPPVFRSAEHVPLQKLLEMTNVFVLPPTAILHDLLLAVKHEDLLVRHTALDVVLLILRRAESVLKYCRQEDCDLTKFYTMAEIEDFHQGLQAGLIKNLPELQVIVHAWQMVVSASGSNQETTTAENKSEGLEQTSTALSLVKEIDHMIKLEQVMCLYIECLPSFNTEGVVNVVSLMEGVRSKVKDMSSEPADLVDKGRDKSFLLQLYLLKILAASDGRKIPWNKQTGGNSLTYLLLEMMVKTSHDAQLCHVTQHLICKLFCGTGFFDVNQEEITVWMMHLQNCAEESQEVLLHFFAKLFTSFISNPYPYIDKIVDVVSDAGTLDTSGGDLETASVGTTDSIIDALLDEESMEIEELIRQERERSDQAQPDTDNTEDLKASFPFTPLVVVALEMLDKEPDNYISVVSYVTCVCLDILHSQTDPRSLCLLVQRSNWVKQSPLLPYFMAWLPKGKLTKLSKCLPDDHSSSEKFSTVLMSLFCNYSTLSKDDAFLEKMKSSLKKLKTSELPGAVSHLILYLKSAISRYDKTPKTGTAQIKLFFSLLVQALLLSKTSPCEHEDVSAGNSITGSSMDTTEFSMLTLPEESTELRQLSLLRLILGDSVLQDYFLSIPMAAGDLNIGPRLKGVDPELSNIVTVEISELVSTSELTLKQSDLDELTRPYFEKVTSVLLTNASERDVLPGALSSALTGFKTYFTTGLLVKVTESLLAAIPHPDDPFVEMEDLSSNSALLLDFLQRLCGSSSSETKLPLKSMNILFWLTDSLDEASFYKVCLNLLQKYPDYALAADADFLDCLLSRPSQASIDMVAILISQNPLLLEHFRDWLQIQGKKIDLEVYSKPCLALLIALKNAGSLNDVKSMVELFWKELAEWIENLSSDVTPGDVDKCHLLSESLHYADSGAISRLLRNITRQIQDDPGSMNFLHLHTMKRACEVKTEYDTTRNRHDQLTLVCLQSLTAVLADKAKRNHRLELELLNTVGERLQAGPSNLKLIKLRKLWKWLVTNLLRCHFTDSRALNILQTLVPFVYCDEPVDFSLSLPTLHQMVMSHSKFLPVMFEDQTSSQIKEGLVSLLVTIVQLCPKCCQTPHIGVILGAYGATLSRTDQQLLKLLQMYEMNGVNMNEYRPFLWGAKAMEYHTVRKNLGPSLCKRPTVTQVLELLDKDRVQMSINQFPLRRPTKFGPVLAAEDLKSEEGCYDPCFLLPLFVHVLGPEHLVDCQQVMETNVVGYVFAALSSHEDHMRSMAYLALRLFHQHVEGARFVGKEQIQYLLEFVRNSLVKPNTKLASIITQFFSKVLQTLSKPEDHMFQMLNAFLLLKPNMDLLNVPEFYKFFNSSAFEYKQERGWILDLLLIGLRETADYRICEKRYIFKLLQSFHDSILSDKWCQVQILKILRAACLEKTVTSDLVRNHGIVTWITGLIQSCSWHPEKEALVIEILHNLWFTVLKHRQATSEDEDQTRCLPVNLTNQVLLALRNTIHQFNEDTAIISASLCLKTLLSVLEHAKATQTRSDIKGHKVMMGDLGLHDVVVLILLYSGVKKDQCLSNIASAILTKTGFHAVESTDKKTLKSNKSKFHSSGASKNQGSRTVIEPSADTASRDTVKDGESEEKFPTEDQDCDFYLDNLLQTILHWKPCDASSNNLSAAVAETVLIVIKLYLVRFSQARTTVLLVKYLQWMKSWLSGDTLVTKQIVVNLLDTESNIEHKTILPMLLDIYPRLLSEGLSQKSEIKATDSGESSNSFTSLTSTFTDCRAELKLLNSVFLLLTRISALHSITQEPSAFLCQIQQIHNTSEKEKDENVGHISVFFRKRFLGEENPTMLPRKSVISASSSRKRKKLNSASTIKVNRAKLKQLISLSTY